VETEALARDLESEHGRLDVLVHCAGALAHGTIEETDVEKSGGPATLSMVARFTGLTRPFNTLGLPALSVPCGFDSNGAPIGLQLVGRPFDEALLYRIGHAYQGATEHHKKVPV